MKNKFGTLVLFLIGMLVLSISVAALPTVEQLKINGDEVSPFGGTQLEVNRGDNLNIKVKLLASGENATDVEVNARVVGYEYQDKESMSDTTHVFDLDNGDTTYKELELRLPTKMDKDFYDLRITVADRTGASNESTYRLHLKGVRHLLTIKDIVLSPEHEVQPGRALLTTVRIKNMGEKTEEGIKVKVSIPDLGVSASDYIEELEADEATTSEELYLRIPKCSEAGTYKLNVDVEFDEGYETVSDETIVKVTEGETCGVAKEEEKTIITVGAETQDVTQGQGGVIYPVTLSNAGKQTKTYIVSVDGADEWANVKVSPSNVVILNSGEAQAVYVYISAKENAAVGEHMFALTIKSGDETLKQIALKANVVAPAAKEETKTGFDAKKAMEVTLIILVVLLVILGLIVGYSKLKGSEEEDKAETYY